MKTLTTIFLLSCFTRSFCQTPAEVGMLYQQHKYTEAREMANTMIANNTNIAFANSIIGRIYVEQREYDSAMSYLQMAINLDAPPTYISGWSFAYLGEAHLITGERQKGMDELNEAIRLHATDNSVAYARHILDATVPEPHWLMMEGKHIIYYFQDSTLPADALKHFINEHEAAYEKINEVFHAVLPHKMIFYVWYDAEFAKRILHRDLGFTDPETCITNTLVTQTIGHEMTHTLAYWGWGRKSEHVTRLINEGVAVAFDQNPNDKFQQARDVVANSNIGSVLNLWDDRTIDARILYPIGGAFLTYLYSKSTPAQFESLIKDQTIENAENIYSNTDFKKMIADFDKMIGL